MMNNSFFLYETPIKSQLIGLEPCWSAVLVYRHDLLAPAADAGMAPVDAYENGPPASAKGPLSTYFFSACSFVAASP